ncbi:MAG TPA: AAA family ATPase [Candidatus Polarisedimenticolia bacterium]|nr:AAA family ATPase [Candidatus Polarisedimenticolia bacterium]
MPARDPLKDLQLLIKSRYSIIVLDTPEADRAQVLLQRLARELGLPFFAWSRTKGLRRDGEASGIYGTQDAAQALAHVEASRLPALYYFDGLGEDLGDRLLATRLKDAAEPLSRSTGALVLSGDGLALPESIKPMAATLKLPSPQLSDYRDLLQRLLKDLSARLPVKVEMSSEDFARLLGNLKGLTLMEAERILTKAVVEDGRLDTADIAGVVSAKKSLVEQEGILEYFPTEEGMADVADLAGLKSWLAERREILTDPSRAARFGLAFPKGVLLLGVPGCGKSLCAKAVAREWGLPLLKLDPANLYNKYVGESEKNFKKAMATAERLAPVILWIDELEKAFPSSGGTEDGGLSLRIFGTFLSWLQDRQGDVFVVATANDVSILPPEFLRKGRFDEIFFVDLPDAQARAALFTIHLGKRGKDPSRFDVPHLVEATEGFGGSEVEQAIVAGLYTAFSGRKDLTTAILLDEISRTRPLAVTMEEKIQSLRKWARERTRSAH